MSKMNVSIVTNAKEETKQFTKGIFPENCNLLFQTEQELIKGIADINVLIPGHINVSGDLIKAGKNLKLIHCGTGYNNVDLNVASAQGVYVAVTPNVAAVSVAELVFAGFFALTKHMVQFDNMMKSGGWKKTDFVDSPQLFSKTLGVIGFGNIGKEAARIGHGLGMQVLAHDPFGKPDNLGTKLVSLEELLRQSDFITLHVLLNKDTNKLINQERLALMKPNAILANASRGPVVDEAALVTALEKGQIRGAFLDVFEKEPLAADSELRRLPNVLLTPHVAYCSDEALAGRYQFFADNCARLSRGEVPNMAVNSQQVGRAA